LHQQSERPHLSPVGSRQIVIGIINDCTSLILCHVVDKPNCGDATTKPQDRSGLGADGNLTGETLYSILGLKVSQQVFSDMLHFLSATLERTCMLLARHVPAPSL
jgi:hypothetical protein